jgi:hypothetical protein
MRAAVVTGRSSKRPSAVPKIARAISRTRSTSKPSIWFVRGFM